MFLELKMKIENENPFFKNENYPQYVDKMWKTLWKSGKLKIKLWKTCGKWFVKFFLDGCCGVML